MSVPSTNAHRANHAEAAVRTYSKAVNQDAEDRETNLTDLLADLRHYSDREMIDFDACNTRAADCYDEESSEGGVRCP